MTDSQIRLHLAPAPKADVRSEREEPSMGWIRMNPVSKAGTLEVTARDMQRAALVTLRRRTLEAMLAPQQRRGMLDLARINLRTWRGHGRGGRPSLPVCF